MIGCPVKVSVIIPVYNVEKYLSACLTTVINQTLYDIEIICVNDGSTDNSLIILEEFARADSRVKIINKENGGLSSARNAGIKEACGNVLMFLDSDDSIAPNACERVWREFLEEPTDIVTFGTKIFPTIPEPSNWHKKVLTIKTKRFYKFTPHILFGGIGATPFVWRQAFSKQLFEKNNVLFNENVKYGEDTVFQFEMFPYAERFSFISDNLYNYRWYREGSLMSSFRDNIDEKISIHFELVETISEYWENEGWLDLYGKEYLEWVLLFLVTDIKNEKVQQEAEHFEKLNCILNKYDLKKHFKEVTPFSRSFVDMLPKNIRKF